MSVYLIIEIKVTNPDLYGRYVAKVADVVLKHGGRYLVRGGKVTPFAGDWKPERMILIEFENMERLQGCFESAEYRRLAPLREQSTITRAVVLEGCPAP